MKQPLTIGIAAVAFAAIVALVVGFHVIDWREKPWNLTKAKFDSVQVGMSLKEVEIILGEGTHTDDRLWTERGGFQGEVVYKWMEQHPSPSQATSGPRREVYVGFSRGKVCDKYFWETSP